MPADDRSNKHSEMSCLIGCWNPKQICFCHAQTSIILPKLGFQSERTNRGANSSQNFLIEGQISSIFHHSLKSTGWWLSRKVHGSERNTTCLRRPSLLKNFLLLYTRQFSTCAGDSRLPAVTEKNVPRSGNCNNLDDDS